MADLPNMDPAPTTKLSFSFKAKPKPKTTAVIPPQLSAWAVLDDDPIEEDAVASKPGRPGMFKPKSLVPTQVVLTKAMKREMEEQKKVDATVYQYDEVYDRLKEADRLAELAREEEAKIRQPKYIGNLLQAADLRKRDHLIAEEKMIQREREMEGDEFADKEKFVTQAYKDQLAENKKAEQAEKLREELEKKQKGKAGPGMAHFYATLLQQSEKKHATVMEAASQPTIGPSVPSDPGNLAIKPPTEGQLSDIEKVKRARAEGKEVELNDDNQIVDKRDLLSAGLNLAGKNTRDLASYRREKQGKAEEEVFNVHTAVGTAASRREIEARRRQEIEAQLAEEEKRRLAEREKEEEEIQRRAVKRKNDDEAVMSARERYLERKRRKLEDPTPEDE